MKTLIIALNSKFIHSSLAPWYLKASCTNQCGLVKVMEFTINDSLDSILADIYRERPDAAAFSCYIWNITHVMRLAETLKKILPDIKIILGGPEVSFDAEELLNSNPYIDYIIRGEGESNFKLILKHLIDGTIRLEDIGNLTYRKDGNVLSNSMCSLIENLDLIPSPYTDEMLASLGNKIAYFESSRGCPFSCSYCISSTIDGVRYLSMDRVKEELIKLVNAGVKMVKFVDRTFNCNRARAKEIFKFIIDKLPHGGFHFEAAADLFDDEIIDILSKAPPGLIQLEIGVQTTNTETHEAVGRKTSLDKVFGFVRKLKELGNIHLHLDLIAGLPLEDYSSFKKSFNDVYGLKPHQLQLGFLKMLKGSRVREEASIYQYRFREYPPYEVLCNKYISFDELLELKGVEEILERYFNSGRFTFSLEFMIKDFFASPFDFYYDFYLYNMNIGYLDRSISSRECYTVLYEYLKTIVPADKMKILNELLKFDFLVSDKSNNLPEGVERLVCRDFNESCFSFLKNEDNIKCYLPGYEGVPAKQIFKQVHFEVFSYNVIEITYCNINTQEQETAILFNYKNRDKVTGLFEHKKVRI
ncbi:MAG: B12-binding domain-containing radical SAM protein [Clostridia bacterium]|nr:B12-binding domain-containing radical SAM protein [Clostridia bacterium]